MIKGAAYVMLKMRPLIIFSLHAVFRRAFNNLLRIGLIFSMIPRNGLLTLFGLGDILGERDRELVY